MICSVEDCTRPLMARGWCGAHYRRWHRYGDPEAVAPRPARIVGERKVCLSCEREMDKGEFPQGWSPCRDCRKTLNYSAGKVCEGCAAPVCDANKSGLCKPCLGARRRATSQQKRLTGRADGYVVLTGHWGHPNARARGHILEHVKVMSDILGRPLRPGENVHHINGVRDDNRPENLELWVVSQPKGQRPADLVAWAYEILERYASGVAA